LSNYLIQQDGGFVGPVREGLGSPFPLNSWQHVALVCDGQFMRLYRNGAPVGAPVPYNGTLNTNLGSPALAIGAKLLTTGLPPGGADAGYWQGKMDDIGLWHRGLSSAEIQAIYHNGLEGRDLTTASVRPRLNITLSGSDLLISWPASPAGACYDLGAAATLPADSWSGVGTAPTLSSGRYWVSLRATNTAQFYRLRK
jgi:hypothetical protein